MGRTMPLDTRVCVCAHTHMHTRMHTHTHTHMHVSTGITCLHGMLQGKIHLFFLLVYVPLPSDRGVQMLG